jgi:hypothetical protein
MCYWQEWVRPTVLVFGGLGRRVCARFRPFLSN